MDYAIKESTLTGMADAIRRYTLGEPELYNHQTEMRYDDGTFPLGYYQSYYQYITNKTKVIIKNITTVDGGSYNSDATGRVGIIRGGIYAGYPKATDVDVFVPKDTTFPFEYQFNYGRFAIFYDADETKSNVIVDLEVIPLNGDATEFKYTPTEMVDEVNTIIDDFNNAAVIPEEELVIHGDCRYMFYEGVWDWYINAFKDKITTNDITNTSYMFQGSDVSSIPFDINMRWYETSNMDSMFAACNKLTQFPKIPKAKPSALSGIFSTCHNIQHIPQDYFDGWDWSFILTSNSAYTGGMSGLVANCYALRTFPKSVYNNANPIAVYNLAIYYNAFNNCYALDEVVDFPCPYTTTWTGSAFYGTVNNCYRLKRFTFALQEDGTPYVMKWKSQTFDLSQYVGYSRNYTPTYIGKEKEVKDDATYQALKDDADWYTNNINYCRYNHDSAVETINTLPDCSAYLAERGGTNTIKFKGAAGALTDGGAINTLTEEEIAVATAKGWTVSLV
jgi:hypothetical protein